MERGFVQGRIDAPPRFRIFLDHVMKQVVQWWNEAGYGVRWGYRGEKLLTHAIWADNIWIFATSHGMYQAMVDILTNRLEAMKLTWKPGSLEYMVVSDSPVPENQRITVSSVLHSEDGKGDSWSAMVVTTAAAERGRNHWCSFMFK